MIRCINRYELITSSQLSNNTCTKFVCFTLNPKVIELYGSIVLRFVVYYRQQPKVEAIFIGWLIHRNGWGVDVGSEGGAEK